FEHLLLGFKEFVIISLRHDRCRFIGLPNDLDTVIRRKRRNELDGLLDVCDLAPEAAVASEEAGCIDAIWTQCLHLFDIGLLLKGRDALQAVRVADAADRIVLDAKVIEALAEWLDTLRDEVGDESLGGQPQRTQILECEPIVTGLLARTFFKV